AELAVPGDRIRQRRLTQPFEGLELHGRLHALDEPRDAAVEAPQMQSARCPAPRQGTPRPQADQIVGSARLRTGPDRGSLPAAERLPLHDRTGDATVHVEIARLHAVEPAREVIR